MNELDLVIDTLEQCAERDIDLTPMIYESFFSSCSDALPLMGHSDQYMRGRMVAQIFEVIMDDSHHGAGGYLRWEVEAHLNDYGVKEGMYNAFLLSIKNAVKETIEDQWKNEYELAWDTRIGQVLMEIKKHAPTH